MTIYKNVVLDLNGRTLATGNYSLQIGGGDLTIQDGSENARGKITGAGILINSTVAGSNTVTLESGTLERTARIVICIFSTGCGAGTGPYLPDKERLPLSAVQRPAGKV